MLCGQFRMECALAGWVARGWSGTGTGQRQRRDRWPRGSSEACSVGLFGACAVGSGAEGLGAGLLHVQAASWLGFSPAKCCLSPLCLFCTPGPSAHQSRSLLAVDCGKHPEVLGPDGTG